MMLSRVYPALEMMFRRFAPFALLIMIVATGWAATASEKSRLGKGVYISEPLVLHQEYELASIHGELSCRACHDGEDGQTLGADCFGCHEDDRPALGKPNCLWCHIQTAIHCTTNQPNDPEAVCGSCHVSHYVPDHFSPHCADCHTTISWSEIRVRPFVETSNCQACHETHKPASHYLDTHCSLCHQDKPWESASFNHVGFTQCESCHEKPSQHRSGACMFCHDTVDWGHAS